jgi:hypothetical protein
MNATETILFLKYQNVTKFSRFRSRENFNDRINKALIFFTGKY